MATLGETQRRAFFDADMSLFSDEERGQVEVLLEQIVPRLDYDAPGHALYQHLCADELDDLMHFLQVARSRERGIPRLAAR